MGGTHYQASPKKTLLTTLILGSLVIALGLSVYYVFLFIRNDHQKQIRENTFRFEVRDIHPLTDQTIQIQAVSDEIEISNPEEWQNADHIYVSIIEADGLARINTISMYDPENADFIEASIESITTKPPFILKIAYPFEKMFSYDLQSGKFKDAYWTILNKPNQQVVALVNIAEGKTKIIDILVDNKSIHNISE